MRINTAKYMLGVLCLLGQMIPSASAQVFATESDAPASTAKAKATTWDDFYNKQSKPGTAKKENPMSPDKGKIDSSRPQKQKVVNPEDYLYKNIPQVDRPTLDGVARGRTSIVPVIKNGKTKTEGYIYLFYSDFNVSSMMNGATTCDVKFQIVTTLDRKLNSLAVRLKWDKMETPLNFIEVNPNQQYHFTYTLLGDGCYSMDKIPNIVINRCRVKGMTQEDCAQRVRWVRKM